MKINTTNMKAAAVLGSTAYLYVKKPEMIGRAVEMGMQTAAFSVVMNAIMTVIERGIGMGK